MYTLSRIKRSATTSKIIRRSKPLETATVQSLRIILYSSPYKRVLNDIPDLGKAMKALIQDYDENFDADYDPEDLEEISRKNARNLIPNIIGNNIIGLIRPVDNIAIGYNTTITGNTVNNIAIGYNYITTLPTNNITIGYNTLPNNIYSGSLASRSTNNTEGGYNVRGERVYSAVHMRDMVSRSPSPTTEIDDSLAGFYERNR